MVVRERGMRMLFKKRVSKVPVSPEPLAADRPMVSFLAADTAIVGTVVSTGEIVADGCIDGPCCAQRLTIGEHGTLRGDVIASEIIVAGHSEGCLHGIRVALRAHGVVDGDVCYRALSVEAGARLNGTCRYADDPFAQVAVAVREKMARLAADTSPHANDTP